MFRDWIAPIREVATTGAVLDECWSAGDSGGSRARLAAGLRVPYLSGMRDAINLADPAFEPTDEQLIGLSKRAFAGVAAKHEAVLARLRAEIRAMSALVMKDLDARAAARSKVP
jgi:hypothetical protein